MYLHVPKCYKIKNSFKLLSSQNISLKKVVTSKNIANSFYTSMVRGDTYQSGEILVAVKLHYVGEGSKEFKALYKAWTESTERPRAFFKPKTGYSGKYGMTVEGPAIYLFKGGSIKPSSYTLQHELFHLKLWFTFIKLGKQGKALYARIPAWLHEADVIGEILKANKRKPGKWSMEEILEDLNSLNDNIKQREIFRTTYRKMVGNKEIELKDLENWDISKWLEKL